VSHFVEPQQTFARPSERPFLRRVEDFAATVLQNHAWHLTDFLTPREKYLLESVTHRHGLVIAFDGGYLAAERTRALLMPENWYPQPEDFSTVRLVIEPVGAKGIDIMHKDVLGSLLGLGIERRVLGDIAEYQGQWFVFVTQTIAPFIQNNLVQVGKFPSIVSIAADRIEVTPPSYEESTVTVASLRVDAVVAQACHKSRSQAQELISRGQVQCNFVPITDMDENIASGDVLSVRGFGRVRILEELGATKKDKIRVRIGTLKSNRR
jgi:RNA-binding protein YlmH